MKKGFTLAEILIVMTVIGVIATLTIPSTIKNVNQVQFKTGYKKAYSNVANIVSRAYSQGKLPNTPDASGSNTKLSEMYNILKESLNISAYAAFKKYNDDGAFERTAFSTTSLSIGSSDSVSPWLITEDNIAYSVLNTGNTKCYNKKDLVSKVTSTTTPFSLSCFCVLVDVNGLGKAPNKMNTLTISSSAATPDFDGDRFYIYIGTDGISSGSKKTYITGRIMADIK